MSVRLRPRIREVGVLPGSGFYFSMASAHLLPRILSLFISLSLTLSSQIAVTLLARSLSPFFPCISPLSSQGICSSSYRLSVPLLPRPPPPFLPGLYPSSFQVLAPPVLNRSLSSFFSGIHLPISRILSSFARYLSLSYQVSALLFPLSIPLGTRSLSLFCPSLRSISVRVSVSFIPCLPSSQVSNPLLFRSLSSRSLSQVPVAPLPRSPTLFFTRFCPYFTQASAPFLTSSQFPPFPDLYSHQSLPMFILPSDLPTLPPPPRLRFSSFQVFNSLISPMLSPHFSVSPFPW
jgi:hypothetical protein